VPGLRIASYGNTVYVTNLEDNTLSVISQGTVKTVNVGSHSYGVAVSPDGSKIYVTNWGTNTVSVLDSTTYRGLADIPVYNLPKEIILDGQNMYVKCMQSNDVSIIDVSQDVVTKTVPLLTSTNVPEFPSLILPVVAIIGLLFVVVRKKEVN
jgi:YVTN family beta-propeller protein